MNTEKRYKILCKLQNDNNGRSDDTELVYQSEFELLIAVLLSAQTRDTQVNTITKKLFKIANTPESMLFFGLNNLKNCIRRIGLFNKKAENIIKTCQLLINNHNGILPKTRLELESLPGVGRKTANIILNIVFGLPTIAVDTHVFRVCNRSRFAIGSNVISVEQKLMSVVPKKFKKHCHLWFVRHGRYTCQSKQPQCYNCIIADLCEFNKKNLFNKKKFN